MNVKSVLTFDLGNAASVDDLQDLFVDLSTLAAQPNGPGSIVKAMHFESGVLTITLQND